ncbi:uncharacterized protein MELLADRAFT_116152 [Melampsora larici-populina 98AG31]|uniref:Cation/H+ exchanger transmembrane domain-containing protein n=1 Tax=Melampsora larici-populina (strain 98AG31 / pathotype 3-4-7) TaxID=747676 RepID=F4RI68_MELLP|nr:uncharacterized protein MELLADRAFT_116152 [Melampsora larici-populina 98AG31]EGG07951.1 hypothetical protein MELLADRAFT_116152 [Melampsora larici-populina 98AG31]
MSTPTNSTSSTKVAAQSLLDPNHKNPFEFDSTDPLVLFIIQAVIIITLSNVLGFFFKRIRQPKVISEVIGGIILGPTAMGRIPNFTNTIFPAISLPYLSLVANIGLVLFLFIVGLEVDFKLMLKNWRSATGVGLVGLIVPFAVGAAVAKGLYGRFVDSSVVSFSHFLLFICVAFAITAFPVLCRILTDLKLLQNHVGISTLAAGVANDVIGWVLLALAVTLVNSGAGITALYVMLVVFGWALFLVFIVRPVFIVIARRSGSFEGGPTPGITCLVLLMTFGSAWFTQVIGVHAIFGGFLIGVIMPHDGGFASVLASKIEDLVTVFFLPLYFTLSGLSTDLGKLNDASIWGWTICVLITAQVSKFVPCFAMALWSGMDWRESGAVGSLMACKGLVELIVLNIALKAGVLNPPIFAMFVLMAVVTTFVTTPLCLAFYPESYREKKELAKLAGQRSLTMGLKPSDSDADTDVRSNILVVLNRLEQLPSIMAFVKLLQPSTKPGWSARPHKASFPGASSVSEKAIGMAAGDDKYSTDVSEVAPAVPTVPQASTQLSVLRLLELSERTSDVMKASESEETAKYDGLLNVFKTFANLSGIEVAQAKMSIIPEDSFVKEIAQTVDHVGSQLLLLPWYLDCNGSPQTASFSSNPIENMLSGKLEGSPLYAALVRAVFAESACDVGLWIDQGTCAGLPLHSSHHTHLFFGFMGGPDDRATLRLLVQFCHQPTVTATVVRVFRAAEPTSEDNPELANRVMAEDVTHSRRLNELTMHAGVTSNDTVYGNTTAAGRLQSETADNLLWHSYFGPESEQTDGTQRHRSSSRIEALSRITSETVSSAVPLHTIMKRAQKTVAGSSSSVIVMTGRSRRGKDSHTAELSQFLKSKMEEKSESRDSPTSEVTPVVQQLGVIASSEVRKSLGDVASGLMASGLGVNMLVIQAAVGKSNQLDERRPSLLTGFFGGGKTSTHDHDEKVA